MFKTVCGGGKGNKTPYDPMIGAATTSAAATAEKAQAFAEKYYNDVVTPLILQQGKSSLESQAKLNTQYDIQNEQAQLASDRYKQYGIPAESRYYDMAAKYSEPQEMERQAQYAKGDLGVAMGNQQTTLMQQYAAMGIDPTSPAAVSAASNASVLNSAAEAGAMNRARNTARDMGMRLTSDAANFGRGGQSGILQFGSGASGNATGAFGVANAALGTGMQAGSGVNEGYRTAMSGFNNNADVYGRMGTASLQAQAANSPMAGLGSLAGQALSKAKFMGGSDISIKENITAVGTLPSGITLYEYDYKPEYRDAWGHGRQVGVIAQEVAPVIPEAVIYDADRGYLLVDYSKVR